MALFEWQRRWLVSGRTTGWKFQSELAVTPGLALDINPAAILLHDAVTDTQTQAHALADVLGGKERIENFADGTWVDPLPIIANDEEAFLPLNTAADFNGWILTGKRFTS